MQKRPLIAVLFLLFLVVMFSPTNAQTRSVFWKRWDVLIDNMDVTSNSFDVTEHYLLEFTGRFRFGSLVIPMNNLEDIGNASVFEGGRPLTVGCDNQPGTYCVENTSDGFLITYYFFQAINDASETFDIHYTVRGALRIYDEGDQLWWIGIPSDHFGFSIGESTIKVVLPEGYAPRKGIDPVETYGAPAHIAVDDRTVTATANSQIDGDESLEIRVQYPHNPSAEPPVWQKAFDEQREDHQSVKPVTDFGWAILIFFLGISGAITLLPLFM